MKSLHQLIPIVGNQFLSLVTGLLGLKLVTLYVEPQVYGNYGLYLTLTQLGMMLTHSGLFNHTIRYWQREKPRAAGYAWFLWIHSWKLGLPLALLTGGVALFMFFQRPAWHWIFLPFLLWFGNMSVALLNVANMAVNAAEQHWRLFWLSLIANATRALVPVLMVLWLAADLRVLATGFALHGFVVLTAIALFFGWVWRGERPSAAACSQWRKELKEYGRPFILMGVGSWLLQFSDRWIVDAFFGEERAGMFVTASNMSVVIPTLISGVLMQWLFPRIFRKSDQANSVEDWRLLAWRCDQIGMLFVGMTLAGLVALQWLGPMLVPWLISNKYADAMRLLLPAGLSAGILLVNQFSYLLLQGQQDSRAMVKVMIWIALSKTLGSLLFAAVSWRAFLIWLVVSFVGGYGLGRHLVRREVFGRSKETAADDTGGHG